VLNSESAALVKAAERESLELLEWPALCRQVARFARTPMGAEVAAAAQLPMGGSQAESERLLQETSEAQQAKLE
jgi:DNA mismatch repair protein MutS2